MPNNVSPALAFLSAIFGHKPVEHLLLIWELNKHGEQESIRNYFFNDLQKAAAHALKPKNETDLYFGVGTLSHKPKSGRGKLDAIGGIGAIHLDVDVAHPNPNVHKKNKLPGTIDDAIAFVHSAGVRPSIIVHSGYGLHAYWLFDDFWIFKDAEDRERAGKLVEAWQRMFKWRAGHHGWDVDATQDLTRVLRVPGTTNFKLPDQPVQASVLQLEDTTRYTPAQFDEFLDAMRAQLPADDKPATKTRTQQKNVVQIKPQPDAAHGDWRDVQIVVDEAVKVDVDTFEALQANVPKFKQTWERKRKDFQDTSASSYDMAIANMAIAAGLDDQTTTNLLIVHRRKHGDEKLRLDYLQRTIYEARSKTHVERERAQAAQAQHHPDDKDSLREQLQRILGFKIEKIVKQLTDPPQFIMHFEGGRQKNMGDAQGIIDQKLFRKHIANTIGHMVPTLKDIHWQPAAQKMLHLAEDQEVSEESTELGEVIEFMKGYLDEFLNTGITATQHRQYAAHHQPAVIEDQVCVHALELWKYAKRNYGFKKTKGELVAMLRRLGASREVYNVRDERQQQHCISVYALPGEWMPAGAVKELPEGSQPDDDVPYAGKF